MKKFTLLLTLLSLPLFATSDMQFSPILASRFPLVNKMTDTSLLRQITYTIKNGGYLTQPEGEIFCQNLMTNPVTAIIVGAAAAAGVYGTIYCLGKALKHFGCTLGYSAGTLLDLGKKSVNGVLRTNMETHAAENGKQILYNAGSTVGWTLGLGASIALGIIPGGIIATYLQTA